MRKMGRSAGSAPRLGHGRYHLAWVRAKSGLGLADLLDRFNGAQQALLSASRAREETAWAEIDGMAARDIANQAFDDGVRAISRDLLAAAGNDRAAEPYARMLPQGLEHEIDTPILEQVSRGTKLLHRLASLAEEDALRKRHEPVLKAALASLDEAIAALSAELEATGRGAG
ncbi:MAG: hypothetical protein HYV63_08305 [Candidatus Schekmanbacteria bacterium]|nr:hypothetical protein [Candidatus Schekmanbacteria bacterium]